MNSVRAGLDPPTESRFPKPAGAFAMSTNFSARKILQKVTEATKTHPIRP